MYTAVIILTLLRALLAHSSKNNKSFYQWLGVDHSASEEQILMAYENQQRLLRNQSINAYQFQLVQWAFDVLSDRIKKSIYDLDGEQEVGTYEYLLQINQVEKRYWKPAWKQIEIQISLKEAFLGVIKFITFSRVSLCRHCQATGALNGHMEQCPQCHGRGQVMQTFNMNGSYFQMQTTCQLCNGAGHSAKHKCPVCHGQKQIMENKTLEIKIKPGVKNESEMIFLGQGDASASSIPGDLIVKIRIQQDSQFVIEGNDLKTFIDISFNEALFGFKRNLIFVTGEFLPIEKIGTSQYKEIIIIKDKGMSVEDGHWGSLLVEIRFSLPQNLTWEQKKIIEEVFNENESLVTAEK